MTTIQAIVFAAEAAGEATSKVLYYVIGGGLTLWALLVSAIGIKRHEGWPGTDSAMKAVMGITVLVVAATMASAVITA